MPPLGVLSRLKTGIKVVVVLTKPLLLLLLPELVLFELVVEELEELNPGGVGMVTKPPVRFVLKLPG